MDPDPGGPKKKRSDTADPEPEYIKIKLQSDGKAWIRIQVRIRMDPH
jgi:hypothetical protein